MEYSEQEFDTTLREVLSEMLGGKLFDIPHLYDALADYFREDVLDRIAEKRGRDENSN